MRVRVGAVLTAGQGDGGAPRHQPPTGGRHGGCGAAATASAGGQSAEAGRSAEAVPPHGAVLNWNKSRLDFGEKFLPVRG